MNVDMEDVVSNGNYVQMSSSEITIFRYINTLLFILLFLFCLLTLLICTYYFYVPCESCDYLNRLLVIAIMLKNIGHINMFIIKIKKRNQIDNNERCKYIFNNLMKIFNYLTFVLVLSCLYLLYFYKNICTTNTLSLKIIKIYYYFALTIYFIPLIFYIFLGLFLSIIICIMVNFSVDENDRIPTPQNIISKLKVMKYEDIDYIYNINNNNNNKKSRNKSYIKKPSFEMIIDKVKNVIRDKSNKETLTKSNSNVLINVNSLSSSDENLQEMLKPLNSDMHDEKNGQTSDGITIDNHGHMDNYTNDLAYGHNDSTEYYNTNNNNNNNKNNSTDKNNNTNESMSKTPKKNITNNNYNELSNEIEDVCSICMLNYISSDDIMILPCDKRHFFHVNCLTKWLYKSQVCPICRTNIVNCVNVKNDVV
ncbi:RING zinc finger protein, putative [Hepatocystis sp. ex Piliocolobus tephrosceles]|nr:RING zinc finger protein, putative [Hepatocystis sp. ex Piliocolobus tephrosceles]